MEPQLRPLFEKRLAGQISAGQFEDEARTLGVTRANLYPQYGEFQRERQQPIDQKQLEADYLEIEQRKKLRSILPGAELERLQTASLAQRAAARIERREQPGRTKAYTYHGYAETDSPTCAVTATVRCVVEFAPPYEATEGQVVARLLQDVPTALAVQLRSEQYISHYTGMKRAPSGNSVDYLKSHIGNTIMSQMSHEPGGRVEDGEQMQPDFEAYIEGLLVFKFTPMEVHLEMD